MNKLSHCNDEFAEDQHGTDRDEKIFYQLYDEAWKSEDSDATSLHEVPVDYLDTSECEDTTVNNAITEVFTDFLLGERVNSSANKYGESDESHSEAEFKTLTALSYVAQYPESAAAMSDNDWNPYGTESDSNISPRFPSNSGSISKQNGSGLSSLTGFNPPLSSTDFNYDTPSVKICSISDPEGHVVNISEQTGDNIASFLKPDVAANFLSVSHTSMSSNQPLVEPREEHIDLNKTLRNPDFETSGRSHTPVHEHATVLNLFDAENRQNNTHEKNRKHEHFFDGKTLTGDEYPTQREQKFMPGNQDLGKVYIRKHSHNRPAVDYNLLQKDLQDIQNSLRSTVGPEINVKTSRADSQARVKMLESSSESEPDIIPSTTTTPDRGRNKMAWDFAADLGYYQPGNLMGDISLDTFTTNSHRPSDGKKSYNSDGDETRTSGSSDKVVDHLTDYQSLVNMSQVLQPHADRESSFRDVDMMLFNFKNQREQIESRYQQLNNQGLAEKVCRILSSQNPQAQVNGLLSEINAQERKMNNRVPLNLQSKDLNFSAISSHLDESGQNLALLDNVRKRLDLSGLSSADASRLADKSSVNMPVGNGFSALDGMAKFLSSQMAKALDRTFNHSIEQIVPQRVVQCYPLTVDSKPQERASNQRFDEEDTKIITAQPLESAANRLREVLTDDISEEEKQSRSAQMLTNANQNSSHLHDDSDSSTGRRREKYRPYRPAGSKEMYYTESDVASVADSVTTMESTHFGSDDARGPLLPSSALGSRQDAPNVVGIYGNRVPLFAQEGDILPPIQEKSGLQDERETESSQSNNGDKTSQSVKLQGKEHIGASDRGSIIGNQQGDSNMPRSHDSNMLRSHDSNMPRSDDSNMPRSQDSNMSRSQDGCKIQDRHGMSQEEGASAHARSELADLREASSHDGAETKSVARWANSRAQTNSGAQERGSRTEGASSSQNTRDEVSDRNDRGTYTSHRSRIDEHQLPRDHYRRPTGMLVEPDYLLTSRSHKETHTDTLALRHPIIYDDDNQRLGQKYQSDEDLNGRREVTYSTRNAAAPAKPMFYPGIPDRSLRSRLLDAEKPFSPQYPLSLNKESYLTERQGALSRSHSDEDLYNPGRSAHISPLFREALSPGLRQAIRSRSPILSRHIERSLSQPPSEWPDHYHRDEPPRDQSSPPFFMAMQRDEPAREYTASALRSPNSARRSNRGRPWSPLLQVRAASPSSGQEDLAQHRHALHQADSQKVAVRKAIPQSDETDMNHQPGRVQLLTQALTHEQELDIPANIGSLWEQFKANNESNESSLSSSSLEAVADLLLNPSPHLINQCLKEREEHIIERQERAEAEREKRRAEKQLGRHPGNQISSEEEFVVGYAELLAEKERERLKRRVAKKKKGKPPGPVSAKSDVSGVENIADKLFSIPEDASFERSPRKSAATPRITVSKVVRQPHIIDPNMEKLRDRISKQKLKIDKQTLKELQRIEKLKKLELLLSAKRKGEISDQTLEIQLEEISSTSTPGSDNSQDGWDKQAEAHNTTPLSDDSTTIKDSSNEMNAWKNDKEFRINEMKSSNKEHIDKHRLFKTGTSSAKGGSQGASTHKSDKNNSQIELLKLVKEGYLTAEEAYRLAVERETLEETSSLEASHESSADELHGSHSARLHRLYSPYSRDDNPVAVKPRYVPKLKSAPSVYEVAGLTYPKTWYKHSERQQSLRNLSSVNDHNDSHPSKPHTGNGFFHPQSSLPATSKAASLERAAMSRSMGQDGRTTSGTSPSRPQAWKANSPIRNEKLSSPSRRGNTDTPIRARSSSPRNKENRRPSNKQGTHFPSQNVRAYGSENEPLMRKQIPDSGGVAWHVPIYVRHGEQKVPRERVCKGLPLLEHKLVNEKLPKKTSQRTLKIEELEPLYGWQKDRQGDRPDGIPRELWEHVVRNDALAGKTNHWEVDPLMDRVQYILNKHSGDSSAEDDRGNPGGKHSSKMSLQEAFLAHNPHFVSKCKERQKRLALASENRKMQEYLRLEREALFIEQIRMGPANLNAHPYSDNLYQPRRRLFSKQEMKEITMKRYKKLPEVLQKQETDKKTELSKINRLRANIFNRKVQRELLRKQCLKGL